MPKILVLYGTTHGHTAKIAGAVAETLRTHNIDVDIASIGPTAPAPHAYDAVIVAASVHAGAFQKPVRQWVRRYAAPLSARPTAFVSVCLSVLRHEPAVQAEVAAIATRFFTATGWRPTISVTFPGALPYTHYGRLTRWLMKRIVASAGGDVDTSRDYEYTDWNAVRTFADQFAARIRLDTAAPQSSLAFH